MNLYDIVVKNRKGEDVSLSAYRGKTLLIVNTATECGFTPQYKGLQELYVKYREMGFEIIDFPCNQFAGQAPGTEEEIHTFCIGRFGITFPQFAKIKVNGKEEAALYTFLKAAKPGRIPWNFTKFLVNREGEVVGRYAPTVTPEKIEPDIVSLLK